MVLEWDPVALATADLRSLTLFRNGAKAGAIPRPLEVTSTKISGLAVDTEYTFHLVLRTSAGAYASRRLPVRTHKMTDLSGITVTPGVLPAQLRYALAGAVERVGGRVVESVRIDTTHFVCTEGRGREWERAVEMNIPVVRPEWIEGCEREGRIVGVRGYYLNADPRLRQIGQGVGAGGAQPGPGRARRTESQSNIQRVPPASVQTGESTTSLGPTTSVSDLSGTSPRTTGNRASDAPEPPTPPAKDGRTPTTAGDSRPVSARSIPQISPALEAVSPAAGTSPEPSRSAEEDDEEDEDSGEDEESTKREAFKSSTAGARNLVQSPFDSGTREQEMPVRSFRAEEHKDKEPSDGGSFSEVTL